MNHYYIYNGFLWHPNYLNYVVSPVIIQSSHLLVSTCFYDSAETEQGVAQAIIRSVVDFKRDPWPRVSDSAKDLVRKMLNPDPKKRLTAQEVLGRIYFLCKFHDTIWFSACTLLLECKL